MPPQHTPGGGGMYAVRQLAQDGVGVGSTEVTAELNAWRAREGRRVEREETGRFMSCRKREIHGMNSG